MAKSKPYYPYFYKDFDAATADWSCASVGAYMRLLNFAWDNDGLPDNPERLRRVCRAEQDEWEDIWIDVSPKFVPDEAGKLRNARQEETRTSVNLKYEQRVEASRIAAERRSRQASKSPNGRPSGASTGPPSGTSTDVPDDRPTGLPDDPSNQNQNQNQKTPNGVDSAVVRVGAGFLIKPTWTPSEEVRAQAKLSGVKPGLVDDPAFLGQFRLKYGFPDGAPCRDAAFAKRYLDWLINETRNPRAAAAMSAPPRTERHML